MKHKMMLQYNMCLISKQNYIVLKEKCYHVIIKSENNKFSLRSAEVRLH